MFTHILTHVMSHNDTDVFRITDSFTPLILSLLANRFVFYIRLTDCSFID